MRRKTAGRPRRTHRPGPFHDASQAFRHACSCGHRYQYSIQLRRCQRRHVQPAQVDMSTDDMFEDAFSGDSDGGDNELRKKRKRVTAKHPQIHQADDAEHSDSVTGPYPCLCGVLIMLSGVQRTTISTVKISQMKRIQQVCDLHRIYLQAHSIGYLSTLMDWLILTISLLTLWRTSCCMHGMEGLELEHLHLPVGLTC